MDALRGVPSLLSSKKGLGGGGDARGPVEAVRGHRKERDPPVFCGEGHEDAVDWLFRYEDVARYNGWTGEEKLHSIGMHLEGIPRRWHLSLNPAPENFADLRARFLLAFKPPNYDLDVETKLRDRVQGEDEPVMTYCHYIIYLCSRVDRNMSETAKVQHLLRGLKRSLVERVYPFLNPEHHTSQDFMRLAQVQCQAVLLANRGVPPSASTLTTLQTALPPTPTVPSSNYVTREELAAHMKELKDLLSQQNQSSRGTSGWKENRRNP